MFHQSNTSITNIQNILLEWKNKCQAERLLIQEKSLHDELANSILNAVTPITTKQNNIQEMNCYYMCNKCGMYNSTIYTDGYYICTKCNNTEEILSLHNNQLYQKNQLNNDVTLGCIILPRRKESSQMKLLRKRTNWISINSYKKNNKSRFHVFIDKIPMKTLLPQLIIDDAYDLYKQICYEYRSKNAIGLIIYCVYRAFNQRNLPRSVREIATIFNVKNNILTKGKQCYMNFLLQKQSNQLITTNNHNHLTRPSQYVLRYCNSIEMNNDILKKIMYLVDFLHDSNLIVNTNASSLSSSFIYYYLTAIIGKKINKGLICKQTQISEVTLNKCIRKYQSIHHILVKLSNEYDKLYTITSS